MYSLKVTSSEEGKLLQLLDSSRTVIGVRDYKAAVEDYHEEIFKKGGDCAVFSIECLQQCYNSSCSIGEHNKLIKVIFYNFRERDKGLQSINFKIQDQEIDETFLKSYFVEQFKKLGLKYISNIDLIFRMYCEAVAEKPPLPLENF